MGEDIPIHEYSSGLRKHNNLRENRNCIKIICDVFKYIDEISKQKDNNKRLRYFGDNG